MYEIVRAASTDPPDVAGFLETLNSLGRSPVPEARHLFDLDAELIVSRAPGRLDVMGGIADYSGSLVLQWPIQEAAFVALQRDPVPRIRIVTLSEDAKREAAFEMALADLENSSGPLPYESAREAFAADQARHWAAYAAGVFLVLVRERHIRFGEGARILIASRVPEGKGVSSSAALEVAVMQAVAAAYDISIDPRDMALLCQMVENLVAGAPCGIMDQMTAVCGEANRLLTLVCQPAELRGMIPIPEDVSFWGLDSGLRHAVTGSDYASVRVGTFMGYRIIAERAGLRACQREAGDRMHVHDPIWSGYLANLSPSEFEQTYRQHLPEMIEGREFLARYVGTTDSVAKVDPERTYVVMAPTAHAVYESHRVRMFAAMMDGPVDDGRLELLGELMYQSHASYSACGLGTAGNDRLVELVREAGPRHGLYGARITGGGSGGTVAVIGRRNGGEAVAAVSRKYANETGYQPQIFSGSSDGAVAFGHLRITRS